MQAYSNIVGDSIHPSSTQILSLVLGLIRLPIQIQASKRRPLGSPAIHCRDRSPNPSNKIREADGTCHVSPYDYLTNLNVNRRCRPFHGLIGSHMPYYPTLKRGATKRSSLSGLILSWPQIKLCRDSFHHRNEFKPRLGLIQHAGIFKHHW